MPRSLKKAHSSPSNCSRRSTSNDKNERRGQDLVAFLPIIPTGRPHDAVHDGSSTSPVCDALWRHKLASSRRRAVKSRGTRETKS